MKSKLTKDFFKGIPKAELHVHLEGTLEPELKLKLAKKNQIDIGYQTIEEIKASYQFDSLSSFLKVYYSGMSVLQTEEDFYQLTIAYLKRAKKQQVCYAELFFDPQAHTSRGISFETVINGYYRGIQAGAELGINASLIMCFLRDEPVESAEKTFETALPHIDKIVGIGLDSDERGNPPQKFAGVFAKAKARGLRTTMHCDIDQENSIEHIRQALLDIGVDRLDHGSNIVENQKLVEYVREKGIGLTCCPVSNSFVVEDMKGNEILQLLAEGVKVTINSDDPAYFQSYLSDDFIRLSEKYQLSLEQVVKLVKNAFQIACLDEAAKDNYLKKVEDYVQIYFAEGRQEE